MKLFFRRGKRRMMTVETFCPVCGKRHKMAQTIELNYVFQADGKIRVENHCTQCGAEYRFEVKMNTFRESITGEGGE